MIIEQTTAEEYGEGQPISETIDESTWYEAEYFLPDRESPNVETQETDDLSSAVNEISEKVEGLGDVLKEILEKRDSGDGEILVETSPVFRVESAEDVTVATYTDLELLDVINENVVAATGIVSLLLSALIGLLVGLEVFKIWLRN